MTPWAEHEYTEYFNERAGVYEFEHGQPRAKAEELAKRDTEELRKHHREVQGD